MNNKELQELLEEIVGPDLVLIPIESEHLLLVGVIIKELRAIRKVLENK